MAVTKVTQRNGSTVVVDPITDRIIRHWAHYFCDSTDALPKNAHNGDKLTEMDTEITRHFSEAHGWQPPRAVNIYGVSWDLSVSNILTRTDKAADFENPTPCIDGEGGSSPFDGLMPWAGMEIVEDEFAGTMVAIPKFYYQIIHDGSKLSVRIADAPADGFHISPAHADRDGTGERDVVYIARYHCATGTGQSLTGSMPMVNISRPSLRAAFEAQCEAYGVSGYSLQDYAMFWTVRLLMLVEYATWDFQSAIGYGCGNGESAELSGSTDSMPYHTGTVSETIDTYAVGVQYRYIEDMWANVAEFIDGWYVVLNEETQMFDVYVNTNIAEFSDDSGGVKIGSINPETVNGFISDWAVPEVEGYTWAMIPSAATMEVETMTEYCADLCGFYGPVLVSGGFFSGQNLYFGPFLLSADDASSAVSAIGARLQKIPLGGLGAAAPSGM